MVLKAKDYIAAGDIFQAVLSQRFETAFPLPPITLYRALRRVNPSPFLYYLDFDSFSHGTLQRFPYVITGHAAWNSEAPSGFRRVAATPSYILWKRIGSMPENRNVLLEGTEPAAHSDCASPEIRILTANPGRASLFSDVVVGGKGRWLPGAGLEPGGSTSQSLRSEMRVIPSSGVGKTSHPA